jgi:hypothetical protein
MQPSWTTQPSECPSLDRSIEAQIPPRQQEMQIAIYSEMGPFPRKQLPWNGKDNGIAKEKRNKLNPKGAIEPDVDVSE